MKTQKSSEFTADALTFVLNSISNVDSVHYKHFVFFRFERECIFL